MSFVQALNQVVSEVRTQVFLPPKLMFFLQLCSPLLCLYGISCIESNYTVFLHLSFILDLRMSECSGFSFVPVFLDFCIAFDTELPKSSCISPLTHGPCVLFTGCSTLCHALSIDSPNPEGVSFPSPSFSTIEANNFLSVQKKPKVSFQPCLLSPAPYS